VDVFISRLLAQRIVLRSACQAAHEELLGRGPVRPDNKHALLLTQLVQAIALDKPKKVEPAAAGLGREVPGG